MGTRLGQIVGFVLLLALAGCKGMFGSQGPPADPLFADRKPTESKTIAGPPSATPDREPTPPVQTFSAGR